MSPWGKSLLKFFLSFQFVQETRESPTKPPNHGKKEKLKTDDIQSISSVFYPFTKGGEIANQTPNPR